MGETIHIETTAYWDTTELNAIQPPLISFPTIPLSISTVSTPEHAIPPEYKRHSIVFSDLTRFPPARNEDHAINLLPSAPDSLNCKIYPLTPKETDACKTFLKENLDKEYIDYSTSKYCSSLFFWKKKDTDELRPIIDYRILNSHTKRDNEPQPLIEVILSSLQGKSIFTKFDIHWGFNNIRIRKED